MDLLRGFSAEWLRAKRTSIFYLAMIVPIFSVLTTVPSPKKFNWATYSFPNASWVVFILPIGIMILSLMSSQLYTNNHMWKNTLVQPISRSTFYLAHTLYLCSIVLIGYLIVMIGQMITGHIIGLSGDFSPMQFIGHFLLSYFACLHLIFLQVWLGARFSGVVAPLMVGLGGWILSGVVSRDLPYLSAWLYPMMIVNEPVTFSIICLGLSILTLTIGFYSFTRMDIH
ncbi:ABC transporter permease [Thermoflavimicrobium daqui]|uniref:ABC transporter permease n=1 Tax=Thermoflavimicrobium daqui TaxID=2137476 RepID=A0A364K4Y4_9BACL|nr:ABC transporter permease [Thermoflavimicrobium daqui]RAL24397.1 hypothetical protein DL897_08710 [Thermoflavimicrobium daqui]